MQTIRLLPGLFSFLIPLFWSIRFFRKRKQSNAFFYAGLLFASVTAMLISDFSIQIRCLSMSRALYLLYPPAMACVPVFYLYYLHCLTSMGKPLPSHAWLFLIIPAAQFLYSGYAFYIDDPDRELEANFYAIVGSNDNWLYPRFKMAYQAKEITGLLMVAGLASIITVPAYFIRRIIGRTGEVSGKIQERAVKRFLLMLTVTFIISIATLIFHFTQRWLIPMELVWGTGFLYTGHLMNKGLAFRRNGTTPHKAVNNDNFLQPEQLIRYFEEQKPWLEPELRINDVATSLGTNRTYLWKLLHDDLHTHFNDFVNRYRIAEFKRLLEQENHPAKMKEIAYKSGFNSYSPFYSAFCKETGISPLEYVEGKNEKRR